MRLILTAAALLACVTVPARAGTLEATADPDTAGPKLELRFDNGDGEKQLLKPRLIDVTIDQKNASILRMLCDSDYKVPKATGRGLTVRTRVGVRSDNGPLRLSETALCKLSSDRERLRCTVEDDGGSFVITSPSAFRDEASCPELTISLEGKSRWRIGGGESADDPSAEFVNTSSREVFIMLQPSEQFKGGNAEDDPVVDVPGFVKEGAVYKKLRKRLLEKWKPFGEQLRTEDECDGSDPRCDLPETRHCAPTGSAACIMVWEHRATKKLMEIRTEGEQDEVVNSAKVAD